MLRCAVHLTCDLTFELLIVLFVDAARPIPFAQDADIEGKGLRRLLSYALHGLDRPDRMWLSRGWLTLEQLATAKDCFEMLIAREVDIVAVNDF